MLSGNVRESMEDSSEWFAWSNFENPHPPYLMAHLQKRRPAEYAIKWGVVWRKKPLSSTKTRDVHSLLWHTNPNSDGMRNPDFDATRTNFVWDGGGPHFKWCVKIILTTPTPHILQKKMPQKYAIQWGSIWNKSRLKSRDFYRKYGIRTPKIWHMHPPFYAIWTVFIGGGGGL